MVTSIKLNLYLILLGNRFITAESGQTGGWSKWRCEQHGQICFNIRTCNSTIDFSCRYKSEVNFTTCPCNAAGWSEWKCFEKDRNCFKFRSCNSTINLNCPKENEVVLIKCPCTAEWSAWGEWGCSHDQYLCLKIRQRHCIPGFKDDSCNELTGKDFETIPCNNDDACKAISTTRATALTIGVTSGPTSFSSSLNLTSPSIEISSSTTTPDKSVGQTASRNQSITTSVPYNYWMEWSEWNCKTVNHICLMSRTRNCSTKNIVDCETTVGGVYFNTELCRPEICSSPVTDSSKTIVSSSQSPISTSPFATALSSTASPYSTSFQTGRVTHQSSNTPLNENKPSVNSTSSYIYWLEWEGWECRQSYIRLMYRSRKCSTYNVDDCETKLGGYYYNLVPWDTKICPESWSEWSNWKCRIMKNGLCNMTRTRTCSTGSVHHCGSNNLESMPCDGATCPDLYKLEKLGYCKRFDSQTCADDDVCNKPSIQLMCLDDAQVASKICPLVCGCCHVDPQWSAWSDWRCERSTNMCRMKQRRTCSTGNTTDCNGISEREAVCDKIICTEPKWEQWSAWECHLRPNNTCSMSRFRNCVDQNLCIGHSYEVDVCTNKQCPDFVGYNVDCSLHNTKTDTCVDAKACHLFKNAPKTMCIDDALACPVTCGCCIPSTQSSAGTAGAFSSSTPSTYMISTDTLAYISTLNPQGSGGTSTNRINPKTTNNPAVIYTQNPQGFNANFSMTTETPLVNNSTYMISTDTLAYTSTLNPQGSGGTSTNRINPKTTNNPAVVYTQNTQGFNATVSMTTETPLVNNSTLHTKTHTHATAKMTTIESLSTTVTQKQLRTPTPVSVTCNVCSGPEFMCEVLYSPQKCDPPNNYCINKLTNHADGTRMVTRHCGNFDTCYQDWFKDSYGSEICRKFEGTSLVNMEFQCTYCCTSDNCNVPIKPLDKDLYNGT